MRGKFLPVNRLKREEEFKELVQRRMGAPAYHVKFRNLS